MVVATPPALTIDEFLKLHGGELGVELVRGQVVRYPMPGAKHGMVCLNAGVIVREFVRSEKTGRACSNDTFVRISDGTLRGADVAYWSYARFPREHPMPDGVIDVSPELVFEVRSPSDLWTDMLGKMLDYIRAGVDVVVILDPPTESATVYRSGTRQDTFEKDETLTIPDVLPGFAVPVARFFEE
jgi:Uma2 family endonuclease